MVKAQTKTQTIDNTQVQQVVQQTVQGYFLNFVKTNGYTIRKYNQLAEQSVQLNGKVKLYFVPLKNGNLKLCLQGVNIPKIDNNLQGVQVLTQNTYPSKYTQRIYFKGSNLTQVQGLIDNLLNQVLPKVQPNN